MLKKKHLHYSLLIIFLTVILFFALQTKPITVDMVKAHSAPMKVVIEEEGKTRVIERFVVTAPIDAYMHRIRFNKGDPVTQGQTLFTLEPLASSILDPRSRSQAMASLGAARELENIIKEMSEAANADKELADITFQRSSKLHKDKVIAQYEMDIAKAEKRRADAVYRASQFAWVFTQYLTQMSRSALDFEDVRQITDDQRRFNVSSMTNGRILKLGDKSERVVKMGEVLMEIGDLNQLEVEADVLSSVAVKLKLAMPVEILRWGGNQTLHGVIKRIESSAFTKISALGVEEQRVKVIIKMNADSKKQSALKDGFRVASRFVLWQSDEHVLQIPNSALFRDKQTPAFAAQENWAVYVIKENHLQKRAVTIGHRNNLMVEVIDGLEEHEQLVAYLSNDLKDGLKVRLRN
ncbi:MAG: HlyD family efflux transporter periplasmic adaptor subunit [gamma proteobacterium symbiont of Bathyaustriella thionipta]|nr:HlyD family efflux transporter periplasmic adaptor subunit [gamma proteobacterium symbiont of Bathyaustriella thionipta]MCU7950012.1 HlyD family efflux transporter periplasmic adaptor subunit [gamma proteobacterium symbiont of Bathyaustriella thionipta]MCU7953811.1 HlyD family efflux transporter periplasmic adaptor subunit [gamma proteobacterium symbiont of Bathyaustriella thionipta]MCU7956608.1 HlyD family efflux transporter periplasmic adaptor subunit [gamma proteobacterium symbiont of Bath